MNTKEFNEGLPAVSSTRSVKCNEGFDANFNYSKISENMNKPKIKEKTEIEKFAVNEEESYKNFLLSQEEDRQTRLRMTCERILKHAHAARMLSEDSMENVKKYTHSFSYKFTILKNDSDTTDAKETGTIGKQKYALKDNIKTLKDFYISFNYLCKTSLVKFGRELTREEKEEKKNQERLTVIIKKAENLKLLGLEMSKILQHLSDTENITRKELEYIKNKIA